MSDFLDDLRSESKVGIVLSTGPAEKSDPPIVHQKFSVEGLDVLVVIGES